MSLNSTSRSQPLSELKLTSKLRFLKPKERNKLSSILLINNSWQQLAGLIRDPDCNEAFLYSADDINVLDSQKKFGRNPADAFLEHWSTYGKCQPDLNTLLAYLKEANLLRAAYFVESNLLKSNIDHYIEKDFDSEEFATIKDNQETREASTTTNICDILQGINLSNLTVYPFQDLFQSTMGFCDLRIEKGGCKIGEGTYGAVYKACVFKKVIAVKKLKDDIHKQFLTEINILARYKHENLLPLLGYSLNGPICCLVYDFMENGSLQENLACHNKTTPLSSAVRMSIAYGTALGINHLHTFEDVPMVHRDIKRLISSLNI